MAAPREGSPRAGRPIALPPAFRRLLAALAPAGAALACTGTPAAAQNAAAVEMERREFAAWLRDDPLSPRRAVTLQAVGGQGITLGPPGSDVPLEGAPAARLAEDGGRLRLRTGGAAQPVPRGRPVMLGRWRLLAAGPVGRASLTVFGPVSRAGHPTEWFPYDPRLVLAVTLAPPREPGTLRVLGPDGVEVLAGQAGTVTVPDGAGTRELRVLRLPGATEEESELEIFFRDATSGRTTYPAGRFVSLLPRPDGRYVLDLNRARNPFCAYNPVFPCPAPWRGNTLGTPVAAGERYTDSSVDSPP